MAKYEVAIVLTQDFIFDTTNEDFIDWCKDGEIASEDITTDLIRDYIESCLEDDISFFEEPAVETIKVEAKK